MGRSNLYTAQLTLTPVRPIDGFSVQESTRFARPRAAVSQWWDRDVPVRRLPPAELDRLTTIARDFAAAPRTEVRDTQRNHGPRGIGDLVKGRGALVVVVWNWHLEPVEGCSDRLVRSYRLVPTARVAPLMDGDVAAAIDRLWRNDTVDLGREERVSLPPAVRAHVLALPESAWCASPECRHELSRANPMDVDHRVPFSEGGTDELNNLQALCRRCNGSKAARGWEEFLRAERRRAA